MLSESHDAAKEAANMVTSISREEAIRILGSPRSWVIADCRDCGNEQDVKVDFAHYNDLLAQIADTSCEKCHKNSLVLGSTA